ncbi:MAG: MFS transporter [Planctomycetes bacterium]|nr:MFS transporter [Planctomycetota bacterium]
MNNTDNQSKEKIKHPLMWMTTLYFAMGVPLNVVAVVAAIMYKNLGISNTDIALYTGAMYLPWVIKPLWSPLIDMYRTKKFFVLFTELAMAVGLGCMALALPLENWLSLSIGLFWVISFLSATQDIAADGVYINAMSAQQQSRYIGLQGICWYGGKILGTGLLVSATGYLHSAESGYGMDWVESWMVIMGALAFTMLALSIWHALFLPTGGAAVKSNEGNAGLGEVLHTFSDVFVTYFQKKNIILMLLFVLFYRLAEGLLEKIGPLFLVDRHDLGGLALDNIAVGNINGTFGSVAFMIGALLGGVLASKYGLKKNLMLFCIMLNVPNLTYVYLSYTLPTDITLITVVFVIEKLGYGIGSVALMLYMMQQIAPGKYKTAHYAISTGFMALCMMLTGMVSGMIQEAVGYQDFFVFVIIATIPSFVITLFAPFNIETE